MQTQSIGTIDLGIDGGDFYSRITLTEEELTAIPEETPVESWLHDQLVAEHCFEGRGPGLLFCDRVSVVPLPNYDDQFIGIIHVRRDC